MNEKETSMGCFAVIWGAVGIELLKKKRTEQSRADAEALEQEHMTTIHADGSECPDGCGGS